MTITEGLAPSSSLTSNSGERVFAMELRCDSEYTTPNRFSVLPSSVMSCPLVTVLFFFSLLGTLSACRSTTFTSFPNRRPIVPFQ